MTRDDPYASIVLAGQLRRGDALLLASFHLIRPRTMVRCGAENLVVGGVNVWPLADPLLVWEVLT